MSTLVKDVELLRQIPIFASIDTPKLKLLAFASRRLSWNAGDVIVRQGEVGDCAYLVIEGSADIYIEQNGEEIPLAVTHKNEIIGEIAILCDIPRTASVRAREPLTMLKIRKEHFMNLICDFPDLGIAVMRDLALRLHSASQDLANARQQSEMAS